MEQTAVKCNFCEDTGFLKYIDMQDKTIPFGVVDLDKHFKIDKCPECNVGGMVSWGLHITVEAMSSCLVNTVQLTNKS